MASNHDMPHTRSATIPAMVMNVVGEPQRVCAVCVMRGVRRSSFTGPGESPR